MIDKYMLLKELSIAGFTQKTLSKALGIGLSTFSAKINGHRSFNTLEIKKMCELLRISDPKKKAAIFLP